MGSQNPASTQWAALILCATALSCSQPPPDLSLEGKAVVLGMPQQEAFRKLSEDCELSQIKQTDVWIVSKKNTKRDPFGGVGTLVFKDGRLTGASRYRGFFKRDQGVEFAKALHDLVSELERSGQRIIDVKSGSQQADNGPFHLITLKFTTRLIVIGLTSNPDPDPRIFLEEQIADPE